MRLVIEKGTTVDSPVDASRGEGFSLYVISFTNELVVRCVHCQSIIAEGKYVVAIKFQDHSWNLVTSRERPVCCEDKKIVPLVFPTEDQADESMHAILSIMQSDPTKKLEEYYFLSVAKYFPMVELPTYH